MEKYRLNSKVNQSIVNGILQGYKNYIDERKVKQQEMNISTAYAWVKGNHIDDQTAEECKELGIEFFKARAGYSWGYLQFTVKDEKSMFIIKNARYFNEEDFPIRKGVQGGKQTEDKESYLKRLSYINNNVKFPQQMTMFQPKKRRLISIFDEETMRQLEEPQTIDLEKEFNRFYIITYQTDVSYAISKISLLMPNPSNNKAYIIDDLSGYIGTSSVSFDDNDYEVLVEDEFDAPDVPAAAEYEIVHEEEQLKEDKGKD